MQCVEIQTEPWKYVLCHKLKLSILLGILCDIKTFFSSALHCMDDISKYFIQTTYYHLLVFIREAFQI